MLSSGLSTWAIACSAGHVSANYSGIPAGPPHLLFKMGSTLQDISIPLIIN